MPKGKVLRGVQVINLHGKHGTYTGLRLHANITLMNLYNPLGQGEPYPIPTYTSLAFHPVKGGEDICYIFLSNTVSVIGKLQKKLPRGCTNRNHHLMG